MRYPHPTRYRYIGNFVGSRGLPIIRPGTRRLVSPSPFLIGLEERTGGFRHYLSSTATTSQTNLQSIRGVHTQEPFLATRYYTTISGSDLEEQERQDVRLSSSAPNNGDDFSNSLKLHQKNPSQTQVDELHPQVQEFIEKIKAINPQSVRDEKIVVQVLEESWNWLEEQQQVGNMAATVTLTESMQHLLDLWIAMHLQNSTRPRTCRPFEILLATWSLAADAQIALLETTDDSTTFHPANQAMNVLVRWYELLGGHVELKPVINDYNLVLGVFSTVSTHLAQQEGQQDQVVFLASEAYDTVQNLNTWGYTSTPTVETNAHLIRCLTNVVTALAPVAARSQYYDEHDKSVIVIDKLKTAWTQLQDTMKDGVQAEATKQFGDPNNSKLSIFDFDTTRKQNPEALFFFCQALCDALVASKEVIQANRRIPAQYGLPVSSKKDEEPWHSWGRALVEYIMDHPERSASILQYAQRDSSVSPAIYQTLIDGCGAWQSLLFNSVRDSPGAVAASEVHNILERINALTRRFGGDSELENYVALIPMYFVTIQAWESVISNTATSHDDKETAMRIQNEVLRQWWDQHERLTARYDMEVQSMVGEGIMGGNPGLSKAKFQQLRQETALSSSFLMNALFEVGHVEKVNDMWKGMTSRELPLDATSYGIILKALADSKRRDAAPTAHKILQQMRADGKAIHSNHYASVLVAWSRSRDSKAPQRALKVFSQLCKDYSSVLQRDDSDAGALKPRAVHYGSLLSTLARCRERHDDVDSATLDVVHDMLEHSPPEQRSEVACNAAFNALARVATLDAALLSQRLLDDMHSVYDRFKDPTMRPQMFDYGNCMHTWARAAAKGQAGDAYLKIKEILVRVESEFLASGKDPALLPSNVQYLALVNSILSTGRVDVGDQAEAVWREMLEKAAQGNAEPPHEWVCNKVIEALSKSGGQHIGERAEAILETMKVAFDVEGIVEAKPKMYAYRGVVQAWSRSTNANKAARAERLLAEMHNLFDNEGNLDVKPDPWTYSEVLNACVHTPVSANASQREKAVHVALQTIVDMHKRQDVVYPFAYRLAFDAISRNVEDPKERQRMASALFERCCKEGLVASNVAQALKRCSPTLYKRLPTALPDQWKRNVKETMAAVANRPHRRHRA
ncbi:Pentatricopeptide repeat-containing protein [Seminavis robusta]|uniref:Pentatricopeptide repeat-containing protein n=1 Tax=Seminavis robusta TaxID=568900 RepID=A0A9N8DEQ6_9STRA|nr:Pentatricopeptide repeat-containing protein [Seminavis robusta]|eukprot:Sro54_g032040.1 Pentatricopeptide repeat-containing protein (1141) ;mRNA; f:118596-122018